MKRLAIALALLSLNEAKADGWRSIGPFFGANARVLSFVIHGTSGVIYATSDSGLTRRTSDTSWTMLRTSFCYPGGGACTYVRKIYLHHLLDSLWFLGEISENTEPFPNILKSPSPQGPWEYTSPASSWGTPHFNLTFHPTVAAKLYASYVAFAFSPDTGRTWTFPAGHSFFNSLQGAPFVAVDDVLPEKIYTRGNVQDSTAWGVQRSTDDGQNWSVIYPDTAYAFYEGGACLARNDTIVIGQSLGWPHRPFSGIIFSSDAGATWTQPLTDRLIYSLVRQRGNPQLLYAGSIGEIFVSTDGGTSWAVYNNTLPPYRINQLMVDPASDTIYAASDGAGILQVYESVVAVNESKSNVPSEVLLHQNFPNPFNPATTIRYELPVPSQVTIEAFSILGQRVALILDEIRPAGTHSILLNADGWPSGVYFIRLNAGGKTRARPIVLLR